MRPTGSNRASTASLPRPNAKGLRLLASGARSGVIMPGLERVPAGCEQIQETTDHDTKTYRFLDYQLLQVVGRYYYVVDGVVEGSKRARAEAWQTIAHVRDTRHV